MLRKVGVDLPKVIVAFAWASVFARNGLTTKAHVVQPIGLRTQIDFDVAQGFPVGQLRKGHGKELVQAREVLDLVLAAVLGHATPEGAHGQIGHG